MYKLTVTTHGGTELQYPGLEQQMAKKLAEDTTKSLLLNNWKAICEPVVIGDYYLQVYNQGAVIITRQ